METSQEKILIATVGDPNDARSCSGMPHRMSRELQANFPHSASVGFDELQGRRGWFRRLIRRFGAFGRRIEKAAFTFDGNAQLIERIIPWSGRYSSKRCAYQASKEVRKLVDEFEPNIVIGLVMPWMLLDIPDRIRLIYFTDLVTSIANRGYSGFKDRSSAYHREAERLERELFQRVDAAAFPASCIRDAAISNGLDSHKAHVVFMGANVEPLRPCAGKQIHSDKVHVLIVASDPVRKQTDLALRACMSVRDTGLDLNVDLIGPPTQFARSLELVHCHGLLNLSNADHSRLHVAALERAHLLLLPSLAEGAAIAPCEAARFGIPSVVSDVGGLPDVVLDNVTGRVLPSIASFEDYSVAMMQILGDPSRFERMSRAALTRANALYTWKSWSRSLLSIARPHQ
jgi:glycosyltransferase involved in cell wall biosynthesis